MAITYKKLLEEAKEREINVTSVIFERVYYLDRELLEKLLKEMCSVLGSNNLDEEFKDNVKEWSPELLEEEGE